MSVASAETAIGLMLATGSKSGLVAPMTMGYYAIGRDSQCQIRPKSRSVSRFHCLVARSPSGMRIMDLDSTCGTLVGDRKLPAKKWTDIRHGDRIRCGKVLFEVSLPPAMVDLSIDSGVDSTAHPAAAQQTDSAETDSAETDPPRAYQTPGETLPTGAALGEDDIANLLMLADEDDRQRRYDRIAGGETETLQTVDDAATSPEKSSTPSALPSSPRATPQVSVEPPNADATQVVDPKSKPATRVDFDRPVAPPKKKKRVKRSASAGAASTIPWKMIAMVSLAVVAIGLLAIQIRKHLGGPQVRVVRGIDS